MTAQRSAGDRWQATIPRRLTVLGRTTARSLAEASGAVASVANPGLYWTIGDSGNPPELLATDSTGALRGRIALAEATNIDWEAVGLGPCGDQRCVYIADTGDNGERRTSVTIYRLAEPVLPLKDAAVRVHAERLTVSYPDHPHDVEAADVLPGGELLLVTKGRSGAVVAFTIPQSAWRSGRPMQAILLDTLPIIPSLGTGRVVTGLAIDRDARRVAVRTYGEIFLFDRDPTTGQLTPHNWTSCTVLGAEPQGEAIAWLGGAWEFLLLSERGLFAAGTVTKVDCSPRS